MEALAEGLGGIDTSLTRRAGDVSSGSYNYFETGDLLIAKVTPCFENGKKALVPSIPGGVGFATSEVHVVRPRLGKIDPRFLLYLLSSEPFRAEGMASMTGAGGLKRVSEAAILNHRPLVTGLDAQQRIAAFLDTETARIDALVEKKQRLISRLQERMIALAHRSTTHGLGSARLAETGIEWNPVAPAHWEAVRMAAIFRESGELGGADLPILSVSINWGISDRELGDEDRQRIVNHIEDRNAYKRVRIGDLVYNMMRAWQGAFGVAKVDGLVSPAYVVARPQADIHSAFFEYLMRTPACVEEFRRASKGIADFRQRLYWEHFRQVRIAVPPLIEQVAIAEALDAEKARMAPLTRANKRSTAALLDRRAALITEAVTGQLDIDAWRRRGSGDAQLDRIAAEAGE